MQKSNSTHCNICSNTRWVCEQHPDKSWSEGNNCCGSSGVPCKCHPLMVLQEFTRRFNQLLNEFDATVFAADHELVSPPKLELGVTIGSEEYVLATNYATHGFVKYDVRVDPHVKQKTFY